MPTRNRWWVRGIQHCLIPAPQHVIVDKDEEGNLRTKLFAPEQNSEVMLKILGYGDATPGTTELEATEAAEVREEERLEAELIKEDA